MRELHVLLRHRLLLKPDGLEGLPLVAETPKSNDLPLAHRGDPGRGLIEGDAAPRSKSEGSSQHEDLSAKVTELLGLNAELGPSRVDVRPEPPVALQAR